MSVHNNGSGVIERVAPGGTFSVAFWVRPNSLSGDTVLFSVDDGFSTFINFAIGFDFPGQLSVFANEFQAQLPNPGTAWVWLAMSVNGTTTNGTIVKCRRASDGSFTTHTGTNGATAGGDIYFAGGGGAFVPDADFRSLKVWNAALTGPQLEAEFSTPSLVRTSNIWFFNDADSTAGGSPQTDESGAGNHFTAAGTWTTGATDPPFVPAPASVTGAETLAAVTESASATVAEDAAEASAAETLAAISESAAFAVRVALTGSDTLASLTETGTATAPLALSGAENLAAVTESAAAGALVALTGAETTAAVTEVATSGSGAVLTGDETTAAVTESVSGAVELDVAGAEALAAVTEAGELEQPDPGISAAEVIAAVSEAGTITSERAVVGDDTVAPITESSLWAVQIAAAAGETVAAITEAATVGQGSFPGHAKIQLTHHEARIILASYTARITLSRPTP